MVRRTRPPPSAGRDIFLPWGRPALPDRRWLSVLASLLLPFSVPFPSALITRLVVPGVQCDPASDGFPDLPLTRGHSGTDDPSDCPDGPGLPAADPSERESVQPLLAQAGPAAPGRGPVTRPGSQPVAHSPGAFQVLRL